MKNIQNDIILIKYLILKNCINALVEHYFVYQGRFVIDTFRISMSVDKT